MFDCYWYDYADCTDIEQIISQAVAKSRTEYVWVLHRAVDYTDFDWHFLPDRHQKDLRHTWASHSNTECYTTWLVPANATGTVFHSDVLPITRRPDALWAWHTDDNVEYANFDFDWFPAVWDWDKSHHFAQAGTEQLCYTSLSRGCTDIKYHKTHLKHRNTMIFYNAVPEITDWTWKCDNRIDYTGFDFTWRPDAWDVNKVHAFAQAGTTQLAYTFLYNPATDPDNVKYHTSDLKFNYQCFISDINALEHTSSEWVWLRDERIDYTGFDFDWLPDAWLKDRVHYFAMAGTKDLALTMLINNQHYDPCKEAVYHHSELQFIHRDILDWRQFKNLSNMCDWDQWVWFCHEDIVYGNFDFNWLPDNWQSNSINYFAMDKTNQLSFTACVNPATYDPDTFPVYHKTNLKFATQNQILPWTDLKNIGFLSNVNSWVWFVDDNIDYSDWDWQWLPDEWEKDQMHCFSMAGTEQLSRTVCVNPHLFKGERKYHTSNLHYKDIQKITTTDLDLNKYRHLDQWIWFIHPDVDYTDFDFSWLPDAWDATLHHKFCMAGTKQLSYTSLVNPAQVAVAASNRPVYHDSDLRFFKTTTLVWPDTEQHQPLLDKFRTLPIPNSEWYWIVDNRVDYTGFDFSWLPDGWDSERIHAFCMSGAEQLSYTWLVPGNLPAPILFKYHTCDLHFKPGVNPVVFWPEFNNTYMPGTDWRDKQTNLARKLTYGSEWCWIIDGRIDYSNFDFSWLPDAWDTGYIHCFVMPGTEQQSYTWLVNAASFAQFAGYKYYSSELKFVKKHADTCVLDTGCNTDMTADFRVRLITTMEEAVRNAVKKAKSEWLWIKADCCDYTGFDFSWLPDLDQTHQSHCWPSGTCEKGDTFLIHVPSFVPDKIQFNFDHASVKRSDWPVVTYTQDSLAQALDLRSTAMYTFFVPAGLPVPAQPDVCIWDKRPVISVNDSNSISLVPRDCLVKKELYEYPHLLKHRAQQDQLSDVVFICNGEPDSEVNYQRLLSVCPAAKRITGVNGRLAAYQAAASISSTPWFIAVFAKCQVTDTFGNLNWQPDYWQEPKHYIFHNHNRNNSLIYGHMAPIAYNVQLMLNNTGGLDMTLVQQHTVVPLTLSETFLTDAWLSWRTAFREVIKIIHYGRINNSVETQYRLHCWQNVATGPEAEWQRRGAADAALYYASTDGDADKLMLTSEWVWLKEYFNSRYSAALTTEMT
jgi:hypothetical protein